MKKYKLLIFIVAYNHEKTIESVINRIPRKLKNLYDLEILIIDDASNDKTFEISKKIQINQKKNNVNVKVFYNPINQGYGGNQKIGYHYSIKNNFDFVVLLHGDGQYPPELLNKFVPFVGSKYGLVYGFRDKSSYPEKEETPLLTYWTIKILGSLESFVTGYKRKEWHNGFVMYSRTFLSKINLTALTDTYHIDGHIQFVAGELNEPVLDIPIWKRYEKYQQLRGLNRLAYIFHVLSLMIRFRVLGSGQTDLGSSSVTYGYSYLPSPSDAVDEIS